MLVSVNYSRRSPSLAFCHLFIYRSRNALLFFLHISFVIVFSVKQCSFLPFFLLLRLFFFCVCVCVCISQTTGCYNRTGGRADEIEKKSSIFVIAPFSVFHDPQIYQLPLAKQKLRGWGRWNNLRFIWFLHSFILLLLT